jgi:hypothetical protein
MAVKGINEKEGWIKAEGRKWSPEVGEYLIGVYKKTQRVKSRDPKKPDLLKYIIQNEEGNEIIVFGTTILDDLFQDIPIGHEVCIEFTGTSPNKPPLSPTKLFEVHHRQVQEDKVTGAAGEDEPQKKPAPQMNTQDPGELAAFIQGVEEDVKDDGNPLIERYMLQKARDQVPREDEEFWQLAKKQIIGNYPTKA